MRYFDFVFHIILHSLLYYRKEMHRFLLLALMAISLGLHAQDKTGVPVDQWVNTLKERITLSGYAQAGYTYSSETNGTNTFDVKRIIFMANGQITDRWRCYFMFNFNNGGNLLELYTEYNFLPQFRLRLGQFKTMFSIENPLSPTVLELINCYSQSVGYLAGISGDPMYGNHAGRDLGLMASGELFGKLLHYDIALMNGQGINVKDKNRHKDVVGNLMLNATPWLSLGGSFVQGKGNALALSAAGGTTQVGEDYTRNRWSAGAVLNTRPLSLRSEYLQGKDGEVKSEGYYATANCHLHRQFDLVASYDYFNKNKATGMKQTNYVAGMQWWFYPKCRLQLQYTYCDPSLTDNYHLLQAQVQVRF